MKYSDDFKHKVLDTYRAEGVTAAAKAHAVARSTVTKWARAAGIRTVVVSRTTAATQAALVSSKHRRAELKSSLLADAEQIRRLILSPTQVMIGGELVTMTHPSPRDMRDLAVSMGILIDKHQVLESLDSNEGVEQAKSMLSALAEQLGVADDRATP